MGVHKRIASLILCFIMAFSMGGNVSSVTAAEATTTETTAEATTAKPKKTTSKPKPTTTARKKKKTTARKKKKTTAKKKKKKKTTTAKKTTTTTTTEKKEDTDEENETTEDRENITAPEEKVVVEASNSEYEKEDGKLRRQLKRLESQKEQLENVSKVEDAIKALYARLEIISKKTAMPLEVLLTGVHRKYTLTANYEVDAELAQLAAQGDDYVTYCLREFSFGEEGGTSLLNSLSQDDEVQLKPYLDKALKRAQLSTSQRNKILQKVNRKIENKRIEISKLSPNKDRVFNPMNLLEKSNLTVDEIRLMLKGTALESLAPAFYKCEERYGVNAVAIMSIAIHESGWGTSRRAREDNNLTGYGVTSDSATGINAQTKEENLLMTAKLLKEKYLIKGSDYYHDAPSLAGVNYHYCVGNEWAPSVTNQGYNLMKKLQ